MQISMSSRKQPKTLSADTKLARALLDKLQLSNLKEEQEVVIAMEYHKIFDVKALWGYSEAELIEGGFPASAAHELVGLARDRIALARAAVARALGSWVAVGHVCIARAAPRRRRVVQPLASINAVSMTAKLSPMSTSTAVFARRSRCRSARRL